MRKNRESHPIIASLDCQHADTIQVAKDFGTEVKAIIEVETHRISFIQIKFNVNSI